MEQSALNVESMMAELSQFDQAAVNSATMMRANFATQLLGISEAVAATALSTFEAFSGAFLNIDAAATTSSQTMNQVFTTATSIANETFSAAFLNIGEVASATAILVGETYGTLLANLSAEMAALQLTGDISFGLMAANVTALFMVMVENILAGLVTLNAAMAISCFGLQTSFTVAFANVLTSFVAYMALMNATLLAGLVAINIVIMTTVEEISANVFEAFKWISDHAIGMRNTIMSVLSLVQNGFDLTGEKGKKAFAGAEININQSLTNIGNVSVENTDKSNEGWRENLSVASDVGGALAGLELICKGLTTAYTMWLAKQAASTTAMVLHTGATVSQTGATVAQTGATAAVGTSFTSAAVGALAFGAGVLALGSGVLLTGMSIALLAKTAFNVLKMLGTDTHGVKASDFDLSFSIPGLATGGFPSTGQMFIAREAGPELVGTIGSRSAVVNNEQIVESVSRGVYDAVRAALGGKASQGGTTEVKLYLDGKQITAAVEKVQRERGLSPTNRSLVMA